MSTVCDMSWMVKILLLVKQLVIDVYM